MNAKQLMECFEHASSLVALCDTNGAIQACSPVLAGFAGEGRPSWDKWLTTQACRELQERLQAARNGEAPFPLDAEIREVAYEIWVDRLTGCADADLMVTFHNQALKKRRDEQMFVMRSMRSMAELTNRIAHDMNNVLSGALGFSSYLQTKFEKGSDVQKQLALIESSALRGHEITQQLLAFSRRRVEKSGQVDLTSIVQAVSADMSAQRGVEVQVRQREAPPVLPGNPEKIKTALTQVVLNACEAQAAKRNRSPIQVTVTYRELTAQERYIFNRPADGRPYACITVADSGAGIPPHILPRVYEPYVTTKPLGESSGLGLSVTHSIIDDHEGMLAITRDAATTHVQILLPFRERKAEEASAAAAPSVPSKIQGNETILIIDDEVIIRRLLGDLLPRFGYTALCAESGREGLRLVQERQEDIDLILLDLNMPGMSGEETYTALREMNEDIPVVIFSGYIAPAIQETLEAKNVSGFIHKPFKNMDLLLQIRKILDA